VWASAALYASAVALAALAVGPAAWLVLVALQPAGTDVGRVGGGVTLANFAGAWREGGLARPLVNSLAVTVLRAGLNVLLAALAAYPLARMRFRGRDALFVLMLATMMVPEQVIVVPMFRTVVRMGLADTLVALVLPVSVSALGVFMCRQAFLQIPPSLEEAARIDGATSWGVFTRVMLPLGAPTLATLGLFSVIASWSDLLWPLLVVQREEHATLPVAVDRLLGVFSTNLRYAYAGSVLSMLPVVAAFLLSQRWFRPGMLAGGVKG
jgi:putative chitobiose transport system permease protein